MRDESHTEDIYLAARTREIRKHFPTALGVDDFLSRLEVSLFSYGFTGENAIAMSNLCRDEITAGLKHKLDHVFGSAFNTNGLGGVLTCGVTGVKAGLSHSPISATSGKERYVFLYDDENRAETLRTLGRFASNPELSFTWYDAAVLSQRIRQESQRVACQGRFQLPAASDADGDGDELCQ